MNNLTTRKIVLGLLMVLVLAFSVQGIADAVEFEEATGDLQTITAESDIFTITVPVTLGTNDTEIRNAGGDLVSDDGSTRIDQDGHKVREIGGTEYRLIKSNPTGTLVTDNTPALSTDGRASSARSPYSVDSNGNVFDSNGATVYVRTGSGTQADQWEYARATGDPADPVSDADRYHYNEEAIKIDIPSGITLTGPVRSTSDVTLTETADSNDSNYLAPTTSITLEGFATSTGKKTISIIDSTPSSDRPGIAAKTLTFIIYVVRLRKDISSTASIRLAGVTNGVGVGYYGRSPEQIYRGDSSHYPVTYTVTDGTIYAQETADRKTEEVTSLVTSSAAKVYMRMGSNTTLVTAQVMGASPNSETTAVYIYGYPTLDVTNGTGDSDLNQTQPGEPGQLIETPFQAKVTDEKGFPVQGVPVKFDVKNKTGAGGTLNPIDVNNDNVPDYLIVDSNNKVIEKPRAGSTLYVRTRDDGLAKIDFELGSAPGDQVVEVQAVGSTKTIKASTPSAGSQQLSIHTNQRQPGDSNIFDLIALVEANEIEQEGLTVTFTTTRGSLKNTPRYVDATNAPLDHPAIDIGDAMTGKDVDDLTGSRGRAHVIYDLGDYTGGAEVTASIREGNVRREIQFSIRGGGTRRPSEPSNAITITLSSTTGEPGEEVTINVSSSPSRALVTLGSNDFGATRFSPQSDVTPFTSTLLLPVEEGTHTFFATGGTFTAGRASVTVEVEQGRLSITAIGTPEAGLQTFSISAVDADGDRAIGTFTARLSGTGFTSRDVEIAGGRGNARVTLPTTARLYTLTVSATGYEDGETPVRIAGTGQQQVADEDEEEVEEEVTVAAEPDSIEITGPSTRSGTVNEELDTPLLVRVLDDDGDGLEGARVFYRVSSGRGRLSARGNGRAIGVVTDDDGYARASFTPLDGGTITVRANTDDLSATVTFTITTGSASSASGARDSGTGGTPGMISPVVHVGAASRPPMLWVDGGAIYALVGASPQRFAASVDNALNIAIGGGKVYWTEKTGESGGTINSANLNGSDVTELTSIKAVPMGIAVDVAGSQLYWTNSRGRIQSADLDGSGITNVMQNLPSPMDLALAGGNAYWTQGNGSVRFVNLRGQKVVRNVSTGTDTPGSLVIGGGKVYWTEKTGESGGTINSANLNGTGATQLASILAAPMGIAVDGSRSKLYWTNSRGRVQSANLDGSGIKNVVSGLGSPSELVLSNSISAPAATTTTRTTTTASNKYDVNGDGSVNNADSDAITVAIAAGATDAKYDVNGDGTVNVFDLVEIIANRDPGAAGAPTLFGMKMSAAQIDSLQEQIDLLIAMNDRSPAALRTLIYLQQLLVTARPEKTQLLANYPNPFNPETWIPYELATDTDVRLTIYNTQGVVIRTLQFGHQSAGYYTGRDRAAYWDGRNALGEQVASGLYFYQLETDEMSLMRKMVILK